EVEFAVVAAADIGLRDALLSPSNDFNDLYRHGLACQPRLFCLFAIKSSTTAGSASVEVSPSEPKSSSAILRRMRRMILPERVLGRPGENWILSGWAMAPISLRTWAISSLRSSSVGSSPDMRV